MSNAHLHAFTLLCSLPKGDPVQNPRGARTFLLTKLWGRRTERTEGERVARRPGPRRTSSSKGQEKSLGPGGCPTVRTVCAGGMHLWVRGHRAGEATDKRIFLYQSQLTFPETKVCNTPKTHYHCTESSGAGEDLKNTNSQLPHRSW